MGYGAGVIWAALALALLAGGLMFLKVEALTGLTRLAYTGLEVGLALALLAAAGLIVLRLIKAAREGSWQGQAGT